LVIALAEVLVCLLLHLLLSQMFREGKPIIIDVEDFQYAYKCKTLWA